MAQTLQATTHTVRGGTFWKYAVLAGLIGGAVFMIAEMLLVMLTGQSPWGPPRMIAAMVLGGDVLPPPASFDLGVVMTAMLVHFLLSAVYGIIIGWIARLVTPGRALLVGAAIGLAIYLVNFYGIASVVFEWFSMARNWVSITAHLIFGLVTAWAFVALARRG